MTLKEKLETMSFSATETHVAAYILSHSDEIDQLTIEELAEATYTSNATIIRLCKKLGYNGYRSFRIAYVKEYENARHQSQAVDFSTPFKELNNRDEVFHSLSSLYKETVDVLISELDLNELGRLASAIHSARRVYIFAIGDSMITAKAFANKLVKLDINVIISNEYGEEMSHGYNITDADLALFVSYSLGGHSFKSAYTQLLKTTRNIAVITANEQSPIYKRARYKILIEDLENKNNIATFYSQLSFEFILNYLYSCLYGFNYRKNSARKSVIATLSERVQDEK